MTSDLFCVPKGLQRTLKNNSMLITGNMFSEEAVSSVCGEWLAWFLKFVFGTGINSDCLQFGGKCQNKHLFSLKLCCL